ncbi:MAG TPA: MFS transporter, partial [Noviherbaspirillum sp.]
KLFGTRYLSTLFGLTLLSHQVGGFFGAWLGGLAFVRFGDYSWMWYADILLALMYGSRALIIGLYLLAPKTALTFYLFAAALGFTWLATVPPTAGLVGKLFGVRYLATLFGLTLLSHQIGGFFGAWLGGLSFVTYGNYNWMWYADIALALAAALVNLPIREAPVARPAAVAA